MYKVKNSVWSTTTSINLWIYTCDYSHYITSNIRLNIILLFESSAKLIIN